eukprot:gene17233-18954_t
MNSNETMKKLEDNLKVLEIKDESTARILEDKKERELRTHLQAINNFMDHGGHYELSENSWTKHYWQKIELVARAFAAVDMNLPILASSEEEQNKLNTNYQNRLKFLNIADPLLVDDSEKSDAISKWPKIDMGSIFSYILKVRDFDYDHIGRYKDHKAYSYFDSGCVE